MADASRTPPSGPAGIFARFFHSEASGSVLLLLFTVVAIAWANSPWAPAYEAMLHAPLGVTLAGWSFSMSAAHWVNDGLMALFFFVVGLEIKRELVVGQLSSLRSALLPVAAAVGGMVVPAGIYAAIAGRGPGAPGWGIPMATDIAFALGVLALAGSRVPVGLKVFLTALAIADDLGAVLVIALFYTAKVNLLALGAAGVLLLLLWLLARAGHRRVGAYLILAIGVWAAMLASGVHATVAGVLVALTVPVKAAIEPGAFLTQVRTRIAQLEQAPLTRASMVNDRQQMAAIEDVAHATLNFLPAGFAIERYLHPISAFIVLPVFALFNAGVRLDGDLRQAFVHPVSLGVLLGLFAGKQIGITLVSWIALKTRVAELPAGVTMGQLHAASVLAGIGFTMSIFVAGLAFPEGDLIGNAKLGILSASALAGVLGFAAVKWAVRKAPAA